MTDKPTRSKSTVVSAKAYAKPRGRPALGHRPLTAAEKQRRYRERRNARLRELEALAASITD